VSLDEKDEKQRALAQRRNNPHISKSSLRSVVILNARSSFTNVAIAYVSLGIMSVPGICRQTEQILLYIEIQYRMGRVKHARQKRRHTSMDVGTRPQE
jgi:hypothetical protein